eukprot:CAMPEP_0113624472 /NCGR_PEP_ID=MMETSP0017_2-20120614/12613_1 /TAXON_ID=2856 /ORGANISM="Cylindrotheca closterium" /LENGTH=597 /DNA_ID=CAMNT_0000534499 /DNA_START=124 /DNA_END=1914 /DNA_ORIENTATION=- /assembly_acc=CAM_ASM_000147
MKFVFTIALLQLLVMGSSLAQNFDYSASPAAEATDRCAIINIAMDESHSMTSAEQDFMRQTAIPRMAETLYSDQYQFDHVFVCSLGFGFLEVNEEFDFENEVNRRKLENLNIDDEDFFGFHLGCTTANPDGTLNNNGVTSWLVSDQEGEGEDGYAAVIRAIQDVPSEIDNIDLLTSCGTLAKNMILVTDEDRDELVPEATIQTVRQKVADTGYILNEVVAVNIREGDIGVRFNYPIDPIDTALETQQFLDSPSPIDYEGAKNEFFVATGGGNWTTEIVYDDWRNLVTNADANEFSKEHYGPLIQNTRGALWSLEVLRNGTAEGNQDIANAFADAFVSIKVDEMVDINPEATIVPTEDDTSVPATQEPSAAPTKNLPDPGSNGDPHFRTWNNEHFEYHGQCDMVLTKDSHFADGLGLEVQIRTKLVRFWSYIKSAAIQIGDDILEVRGNDDKAAAGVTTNKYYWMNLEENGTLRTIGGFPVSMRVQSKDKRLFIIDLDSRFPGQQIKISTFREFVRVDFAQANEEAFGNTVGMLGDYKTGKTLARDGATVLDDFTDLGREWQVLPSLDKKLFRESSHPQFPELCMEPEDPRGVRRRRR